MNTQTKIALIAIVAIVLLLVGINWGCGSAEVSKRNQVFAQQEICKANFDKMWKIIETQAQVPSQYKEDFLEIYQTMMEGRYGEDDGNVVFKWINEANPQYTPELYSKLMVSIEANRNEFFQEQKKLISAKQEHDNFRMKLKIFPVSILYFGTVDEVQITTITSQKTVDVYKTGKEELEPLFKDKKEKK